MKLLFSTVIRSAPVKDGGNFIVLDWSKKTELFAEKIIPDSPYIDDPNPRGNARGGRGLEIIGNEIYVATYYSIHVYDFKFTLQRTITNNNFAGIHEIFYIDEILYVTSTALDLLIGVNPKTGESVTEFWLRDDEALIKKLNLSPNIVDKNADNRLKYLMLSEKEECSHLHLNAVANYNNELIVLLNRYGVLYNLSTHKILLKDPIVKGAHNLVLLGDKLILNSTQTNRIVFFSLTNNCISKEIDLLGFPEIKKVYNKFQKKFYHNFLEKFGFKVPDDNIAAALFWRGMDVHEDKLYIGTSPASIYCFSLSNESLEDIFIHSNNINEVIHGLKVQV